MSYVLTSAPQGEPVTLPVARGFLQLDADLYDDDALLLQVLLPTARAAAEHRTGRALITQQWRRSLDCWPCNGVIELEHAPLQSVQSVQYRNELGVWITVAPSVYVVDVESLPGRVAPAFGQVWPTVNPGLGVVRVDYTAGYGDTEADVPEGIRHWILLRTKSLWDYRSESVELLRGRLEQPSFIDSLLDGFKVASY